MTSNGKTRSDPKYPNATIEQYFAFKLKTYELFSYMRPWERWFVLRREARLILMYVAGTVLARLVFFTIPEVRAQTLNEGTLFGMTWTEVGLVTYWGLHAFLALIVAATVIHLLLARNPRPWARETATFLLGFLAHTAVPYPLHGL